MTKTSELASQIRNPYFTSTTKDYIYKADLNFYKKKFSGIFVIKKTSDSTHRVVYTTEMGNKIFDFSFMKNEFKVNSILKEIDKKIIVSIFKKDLYPLFNEYNLGTKTYQKDNLLVKKASVEKESIFYYFKKELLTKIVRANNHSEKVVYTFDNISKTEAKNITIEHKDFKFKIRLKAL